MKFDYNSFKKSKENAVYRKDPVPGTGKTRGSHQFRSPRTTNERRQTFKHPKYVRAKRSNCNLPEDWDDISRSNQYERSWKNQKKRKQWM